MEGRMVQRWYEEQEQEVTFCHPFIHVVKGHTAQAVPNARVTVSRQRHM
jgi:hypothetical protein